MNLNEQDKPFSYVSHATILSILTIGAKRHQAMIKKMTNKKTIFIKALENVKNVIQQGRQIR